VREEAISVFISYSRKDKDLLDSFIIHLAGLVNTGQITPWHDQAIEAGSEWEPILLHQLNTAKIIILLISANFIDSEYCYGKELKLAIKRHDAGEAHVIPVILKPCLWNLPKILFSKLNVLPNDALPVTQWNDPDAAFTVVVAHIAEIVDRLALSAFQRQKLKILQPSTVSVALSESGAQDMVGVNRIQDFPFEVITVDRVGNENNRFTKIADFFAEQLGDQTSLEMVRIPSGIFQMGSLTGKENYDEQPRHEVQVPEFWMGKYPVTQAQWRYVASLPQEYIELDTKPSRFDGDNRPVERVNWNHTVEFCRRLSRKTGDVYRLPSEAEWEYACRAKTLTEFHFGDIATPGLVNCNNEVGMTTEVGAYKPNSFGLYDMHGNVWEWCADSWHHNYDRSPVDGSAWLNSIDSMRVLRGGSWGYAPNGCRSAYRFGFDKVKHNSFCGFRVVYSLEKTALQSIE
jgi:formylglycine-generating enzyme required for sulfatase activity